MLYLNSNSDFPNDGSPYGPLYGNTGMPYMGERPLRRFPRSSRRGCLGCLAPLVIIALIIAVLSYGFGIPLSWGPTIIPVSENPTLIVESFNNQHSQIFIHAGGNDHQITIQPVRPLNLPVGLHESYQESSDHQTVIYDIAPNISGTFDITVPVHTNLQVDSNNATILVNGITGHMHLEANSGDVIVKQSTITGPSLLRDNSSALQATQDQINGAVTLENNSGDITFQGTLDPVGNYQIAGNGGDITLTIPPDAALQINASTIKGSISSTLPGVKAESSVTGFALQASLGKAPRAQLTLYNNDGGITINEQGS